MFNMQERYSATDHKDKQRHIFTLLLKIETCQKKKWQQINMYADSNM